MEFASKTPWAHKLQKDLMRDFYTLLFDVQLGDGHYAPDTGGKGSDPHWHDASLEYPRTGGFVLTYAGDRRVRGDENYFAKSPR